MAIDLSCCRVAAIGCDFFSPVLLCGYRPFPSQCLERGEKGQLLFIPISLKKKREKKNPLVNSSQPKGL